MTPTTLQTVSWSQAFRRALTSGTVASLLSTIALAACGRWEGSTAVGPINGPSQWIWGESAAHQRAMSFRHTVLGYAIHHLTSLGWATLHEKHVAGLTANKGLPWRLAASSATAAVACWVDYRVAFGRLQPGFDKQLGKTSLLLVYAAFAVGLALAPSLRARQCAPMSDITDGVRTQQPT